MAVSSGARLSGEAAKTRSNERRTREKNNSLLVAPATISSHFHRPRAPLLVCAPQQNWHALQARIAVVGLAQGLSARSLSLPFTLPTISLLLFKEKWERQNKDESKDNWRWMKRNQKEN